MGRISQWEGLSHILWKIKNVPNHQPDIDLFTCNFPNLNFKHLKIKDPESSTLPISINPSLRLYKCLRSRRFRFFHLDLFRG